MDNPFVKFVSNNRFLIVFFYLSQCHVGLLLQPTAGCGYMDYLLLLVCRLTYFSLHSRQKIFSTLESFSVLFCRVLPRLHTFFSGLSFIPAFSFRKLFCRGCLLDISIIRLDQSNRDEFSVSL